MELNTGETEGKKHHPYLSIKIAENYGNEYTLKQTKSKFNLGEMQCDIVNGVMCYVILLWI